MIYTPRVIAENILQTTKNAVQKLPDTLTLAIVLVGDNPASEVYVTNKIKKCGEVGIRGVLHRYATDISQEDLVQVIEKLNADTVITGILVQSPLPRHIDAQSIFDSISAFKDVDGFGMKNIARLYTGDESGLMPATPSGVMRILEAYFGKKPRTKNQEPKTMLVGKTATIIGKSTIVGKPLALMMLHAGITTTICHSRTNNLSHHTQLADIIVVAAGKKNLLTAEMVRDGALVIDVGINVVERESKRYISGDCDTESIAVKADITPTPGGVGPMTIACLLANVLQAYTLQNT